MWRGLVSEELQSKKVVHFITTSTNMILKLLVNNEVGKQTHRRNKEKKLRKGKAVREGLEISNSL